MKKKKKNKNEERSISEQARENKRPPFGEIFRYFQETRNNHALRRSFIAYVTLLQVLEGYVNKETFTRKTS